jgi:hypothetical protein
MTEGERTDVLKTDLEAFKKLMEERDRRITERFQAMDEKTGLALTSSKEAVAKAETATEKRFDAVNEFRGQLKDQASTLLPRAEAEAKFKAYDDKFEDNKKEKSGTSQWAIGLAVVMVLQIIEILVLFFRK